MLGVFFFQTSQSVLNCFKFVENNCIKSAHHQADKCFFQTHLQIPINNILWMQVFECWHNLGTIKACTVFCEHSFPWQVEEELKETITEDNNHLTFDKTWLSMHGELLTQGVYISHLASISILHYKTQAIIGLEGIF